MLSHQKLKVYRQVDKAATSVILNIAEGYGKVPPRKLSNLQGQASCLSKLTIATVLIRETGFRLLSLDCGRMRA